MVAFAAGSDSTNSFLGCLSSGAGVLTEIQGTVSLTQAPWASFQDSQAGGNPELGSPDSAVLKGP